MTVRTLLPTGLQDVLPIDAENEANVVECLMKTFASFGYDRVKPPMIEFEDNLLAGSGAAIASQTFRVMDPISQRMLGIRPDMTVQIERIATSRLAKMPRPLRLSYSGQVLRVRGSQLRPERQFGQAGVEMIGVDSSASDCEVVVLATDSLKKAGMNDLTVDLGLPMLVPALCESLKLDEATEDTLREALNRKDAASVKALGGQVAELFGLLIDSAGPAKRAIEMLKTLSLSGDAAALIQRLIDTYDLIKTQAPEIGLTIDTVENRGYEYHSGVTYTFYAKGVTGELGRGGRYVTETGEAACGFTLFVDSLMRALPKPAHPNKVFIPAKTEGSVATELRDQGHICINALAEHEDDKIEARRLACTHIFLNGQIEPLS